MKADVNGIDLGYSTQGSGTPVVLVHGYPLTKDMWEHQVSELSRDFQVIAVDLRGHGESQVVEGPGSMETFADDIDALLEHLHIASAVIVGFSMGGYATFAFLRKYAAKVKALALVDTRAQSDTPEAAEGRRNTAKSVIESSSTAAVVDALIPRLLTQASVDGNKALVDRTRAILSSVAPQAVYADLHALADRPDSRDLLPKITCPTLVVVGDSDALTPPADAELMAQSIAGAKLVTVPRAAHLSPMEQPEAVTAALRSFLSGLK